MEKKRKRKHGQIYMIVAIVLTIILMTYTITKIKEVQQGLEKKREKTIEHIRNPERAAGIESAKISGYIEVIRIEEENSVIPSKDDDNLKPETEPNPESEPEFAYYEIPAEYSIYGGTLPEEVQRYTYDICKQYGVRYALIIALIEAESGYRHDKVGDDGKSMGYMQVMQKWHKDRMKKLEVNDLMNPYQNIIVGIDFLAELLEKYGEKDALTAYNYGEDRAKLLLWEKGIYEYSYNRKIIKRAKEIEEVLSQ